MQDMLTLAKQAFSNAYVPYLEFRVGACIKTDAGELYAGCNVQNSAFPVAFCAETCATGKMISSGGKRIAEVLVYAEGSEECTPCGGCRQILSEFSTPDTKVHIVNQNGHQATYTMEELLPHAFSTTNLQETEESK